MQISISVGYASIDFSVHFIWLISLFFFLRSSSSDHRTLIQSFQEEFLYLVNGRVISRGGSGRRGGSHGACLGSIGFSKEDHDEHDDIVGFNIFWNGF